MRTLQTPRPAPGSIILNSHATRTRSLREAQGRVQNACGRCGAAAYRPLMARDEGGVMRASGRYQCVRCRLEFLQVDQWRAGTDLREPTH